MTQNNPSILFLGKKHDECTGKALEFCRQHSAAVSSFLSDWGEPLPEEVASWEGDYIISYLSRWILPERVLLNAKIGAINFHPGPPEYPGIGCTNFALYDGSPTYGATCHYMLPRVDTGEIIAVRRFPLFPTDTVASLLNRTYEQQLDLFIEIMGLIFSEKKVQVSGEKWRRKAFTREEFNALCRINCDMTTEEITRRIRATAFGSWKPTIELHGFIFELKDLT